MLLFEVDRSTMISPELFCALELKPIFEVKLFKVDQNVNKGKIKTEK